MDINVAALRLKAIEEMGKQLEFLREQFSDLHYSDQLESFERANEIIRMMNSLVTEN